MYRKIQILLFVITLFASASLSAFAGSPSLQDAFDPSTLGVAALDAGYELSKSEPMDMVSDVISVVLSLLGVIFLILLIYGGFLWMTARGNEQQVGKAKEVMYSAIVGLIIVLAAYSVSYFVIESFTKGILS